MKSKSIIIFFLLSLIGLGLGLCLKSSTELGFCMTSEPACINLLTKIGNALFYSMQAFAVSFALLMFVPRAVGPWKKFAIWFIPLMVICFLLYKNEGFFSVPEESVYRFLSIIYGLVSVAIIAIVAAVKGTKKN